MANLILSATLVSFPCPVLLWSLALLLQRQGTLALVRASTPLAVGPPFLGFSSWCAAPDNTSHVCCGSRHCGVSAFQGYTSPAALLCLLEAWLALRSLFEQQGDLGSFVVVDNEFFVSCPNSCPRTTSERDPICR